MNEIEQKEAADFLENVEKGRRIVSEMSDSSSFDIPEIKAISCFAAWQSMSDLDQSIRIQAARMSVEAAYKFGKMLAGNKLQENLFRAEQALELLDAIMPKKVKLAKKIAASFDPDSTLGEYCQQLANGIDRMRE